MKDKKAKISKSNSELFGKIFGEEMKSPNVDEKNDDIFKMQRDQLPLGYRISETVFNYMVVFFTNIVPFGIIVNSSISFFSNEHKFKMFFKDIFPKVFILMIVCLLVLLGIRFLQAVVNSILLIYYSKANKKNLEKIEKTKQMIKEALDKKDKEEKEKEQIELKNQADKMSDEIKKLNEERKKIADISKIISDFYLETQNETIKQAYKYDDSFSTKFKNDITFTLFALYDIRKITGSIDFVEHPDHKKELENRTRSTVYNLDMSLKCLLECKCVEANKKLSDLLFCP